MGLDASIKMFQAGTKPKEIIEKWNKTPELAYWRNFHELDTAWLQNERLEANSDCFVYVSLKELLDWREIFHPLFLRYLEKVELLWEEGEEIEKWEDSFRELADDCCQKALGMDFCNFHYKLYRLCTLLEMAKANEEEWKDAIFVYSRSY